MYGRELVGGPDGEDDEEDEAGEVDGTASAEAGVTTDVDHANVGQPHGEREQDFGIEEVAGTNRLLGDERADEQAGGHAGEPEEESLEGDLVDCFERWEPGGVGSSVFGFEATLLSQIEDGSKEREQQRGIGGEQESDVEEDPASVKLREGGALLAGMAGRDEAEEKADREDEDAEGDGAVSPVDEQEGEGQDEAEDGLCFMGIDWQTVVGGAEGLGEGDEVKEDRGDGRWDSDVAPAGTVVEGGRKNGERGDAVEENCDSEPEEGHEDITFRVIPANLQYIGSKGIKVSRCGILTVRDGTRDGKRFEY
jgi:hypothetical protein